MGRLVRHWTAWPGGFSEEVTFEISHQGKLWAKHSPVRGHSECKGPGALVCWMCSRGAARGPAGWRAVGRGRRWDGQQAPDHAPVWVPVKGLGFQWVGDSPGAFQQGSPWLRWRGETGEGREWQREEAVEL